MNDHICYFFHIWLCDFFYFFQLGFGNVLLISKIISSFGKCQKQKVIRLKRIGHSLALNRECHLKYAKEEIHSFVGLWGLEDYALIKVYLQRKAKTPYSLFLLLNALKACLCFCHNIFIKAYSITQKKRKRKWNIIKINEFVLLREEITFSSISVILYKKLFKGYFSEILKLIVNWNCFWALSAVKEQHRINVTLSPVTTCFWCTCKNNSCTWEGRNFKHK